MERLIKLSLVLSFSAFIASLFSLMIAYSLFFQIKGFLPYINESYKLLPNTTFIDYSITTVGRFLLINFPSIFGIFIFTLLFLLLLLFKR